jgi:hypothetical protein
MDVDVEIDRADASLRCAVGATLIPTAVACARVCDIGEFQTPPLRQLAAAGPGKLPRQHGLFAIPVGTDDVRTQFAGATVVAADHLLFAKDSVAEDGVIGAGHCGVAADRLR